MIDWDKDIFQRAGEFFEDKEQQAQKDDIWSADKQYLDEHIQSFAFLDELLANYQGVSLEQEFNGHEIDNDFGRCYVITRQYDLGLDLLNKNEARQLLLSDLTLVDQVREKREEELKALGYNDLYQLASHPRFGAIASTVVDMIENEQIDFLVNYIRLRHRLSSWQMYVCSAFFQAEDFLFFDLETMGLAQNPIILAGLGYFIDNKLVVEQLLALSQEDEPALLWEFFQRAEGKRALVSFNGVGFDQTMINRRSIYNALDRQLDMPHFDMLYLSRRVWRDAPGYKLRTLEKFILDIERDRDVPSSLVPVFYEKYEQTGNIGPIVPIIYHNQKDVVSTVMLFNKIKKYFLHD